MQFADLTVPSGVTAGAAPIAGADVGNVGSQSTTVGNVLANDFDFQALQGDETLTVSGVNGLPANVGNPITLASGALLNLNSNGTFTYDPNGAFDGLLPGQVGTDTFSYTVSDGNGGTDTATVTMHVNDGSSMIGF